MITSNVAQYTAKTIPNAIKTSIALGIVDQTEANGGRFLCCVNDRWCRMRREKVITKVKKALIDKHSAVRNRVGVVESQTSRNTTDQSNTSSSNLTSSTNLDFRSPGSEIIASLPDIQGTGSIVGEDAYQGSIVDAQANQGNKANGQTNQSITVDEEEKEETIESVLSLSMTNPLLSTLCDSLTDLSCVDEC